MTRSLASAGSSQDSKTSASKTARWGRRRSHQAPRSIERAHETSPNGMTAGRPCSPVTSPGANRLQTNDNEDQTHLMEGRTAPEGSNLDEIILAVDWRGQDMAGCAFFNTADGTLAVTEDIPMATLDVVEQFVLQVQPTTLLISSRTSEALLKLLEELSQQAHTDGGMESFILRATSSADFSVAHAREKLMSVDANTSASPLGVVFTPYDHPDDGNQDSTMSCEASNIKSIRCGTHIDLESHVSVGCAGAVLTDLHRRRSVGFLPDGQRAEVVFHVQSLNTFSLSDSMFLSTETLQSLQIIRSESHPNHQISGSHTSDTGSKESLSIYGLFHLHACTPQGRIQLRRVLLRPSLNLHLLNERQKTVALFLRPENSELLKESTVVLRKVKNGRSMILQLRKGVDSSNSTRSFDSSVWGGLRNLAAEALRLREIMSNVNGAGEVEIVRKILVGINQTDLVTVGDMINRIIDFEQSKARHRPSVRAGVDIRLDELKRRYDGMGSFLTEVVNHINDRLPEWARKYIRSCIFLPQLGFLTVVEPDSRTGRGKYEGEGTAGDQWESLFNADGAVCYKNKFMKDLDEQYGDMYCEIGDREVEIMFDLAREVLKREDALKAASDICGELDVLLTFAKAAQDYNWVCPQLTSSGTLHIEGGRHPLMELVVPSFVPNDCELERDQQLVEDRGGHLKAMVLTGPNHSGKSIYLKQVAIIVYLAHIGSFVPADRAKIGLTDKILTRISTRESVTGNESAFATDLRQIAHSTRCATSRSLVLIDEFGKGTNADDGAGLLTAVLDHFLTQSSASPRLILATHCHELFEGGYVSGYYGLYLAQMQVEANYGHDQSREQITYLFKLAPGHGTSSFGSRCAALNGVPNAIVDRAEGIAQLLARQEDLISACARLSTEEEQRLAEAEVVARRFLQHDFAEDISSFVGSKSLRDVVQGLLKPG